MLMFWSMFYLKTNRIIFLQKKHEVKGLLDRYGEKLIFTIVGAALAVVGQIVVKMYLGK